MEIQHCGRNKEILMCWISVVGKMRDMIIGYEGSTIMQQPSRHPSWLTSGVGGRTEVFWDPGIISAVYLHLKSGCTDKEWKGFQGRNVTTWYISYRKCKHNIDYLVKYIISETIQLLKAEVCTLYFLVWDHYNSSPLSHGGYAPDLL